MHHRAMISDTTIYNKLPNECTFDLEMIHVIDCWMLSANEQTYMSKWEQIYRKHNQAHRFFFQWTGGTEVPTGNILKQKEVQNEYTKTETG
jgi:hypothetical protein